MKQHVKFYTILKAKTLMLTYLRKNYLVIRFKGIKDLIFSSSNLKRHVKLLEEVTKNYVVNIQRTSVIPFFVESHRKVKRWSGGPALFWLVNDILANHLKHLPSENTHRPRRYCPSFHLNSLYIVEKLNTREFKNWNERVIYLKKVRYLLSL